MNCEQVHLLLDTHAPDALAPEHRRAIDLHLAACCNCRVAWAAYRELAAAPVPAVPAGLGPRIAAAIAGSGAHPRRVRPLAVGALLAVAAAGAVTVVVQLGGRTSGDVGLESPPADAAAPAAEPGTGAAPVAGQEESVGDSGAVVVPTAPAYALDRLSVVVFAAPGAASAPDAAAQLAECREHVVRELRAVDGLNVIAGEPVAAYAGSSLSAEEIAVELGAGSVLVLTTADRATLERIAATRASLGVSSRVGSCLASLLDARTADVRVDDRRISGDWNTEQARVFATTVADSVREAVLEDPAARIAEARATVLDATRGARERVNALSRLRGGAVFAEPLSLGAETGATAPIVILQSSVEPIAGAFDDAIVAAAVQLGSAAEAPRVREAAWRGLRGVRDPNAIEALTTSLASDPDENVRRGAALALGYVVDAPGVRDALLRAAAQDPSTEPAIPCCVPSVRGAAERALRSDAELNAAALGIVRDETLPDDERLRPLYQSLDGRGFPVALDAAAARAVFEIGSAAGDPLVRGRAWDALSGVRDADFTATLLADLAGHAAENVRAAAAAALAPHAGDEAVRAALEQARADPSIAVRRAARAALDEAARR